MDWGTVPAWIGSILSGASVLLAFYILHRDRDLRLGMQASLTVAWMEKHANETLIYMRNTSEMPIFQPVYIKKKRRFLFWFIKAEEGRMAPVTQPNELHSKQSISRKVKQSEKCRFYVQFMSADGLAWERDLQTGKVRNLHRWRASL